MVNNNVYKILFISIFISFILISCTKNSDNGLNSSNSDTKNKTIITIATGTIGNELELTNQLVDLYNSTNDNVIVKVIDIPEMANDRLGFYNQFFSSQSPELDIFQIDVIWTADLSEHFVDLYEYGATKLVDKHFPSIVENNEVDGALTSMPLFTDAGLLYYRTDLIEEYGLTVPKTWNELEEYALIIQEGERKKGNEDFYGYVWQGNSYEGLTCNALEWIVSNNGGTIVNANGDITINNHNALEMIDKAASWVGTISPNNITTLNEERTRAIWEKGNAAFMRNWPYAYSLSNSEDSQVKGNFDVTTLPSGKGSSASTLGGWQLAVSKYSNNIKEAVDFVFFMTSEEAQKLRAIEGSFPPTIMSLYHDDEVLESVPFFESLYDVFINSFPRPSNITSPYYNDVSTVFYRSIHSVLTGKMSTQAALEQIEVELQKILK